MNSGIIRSASIDGTDVGILFSGAGSITSSGTIESQTGTVAILFQGGAAHTLTLGTGSVLGGNVQGGTGTDNLQLTSSGTEAIGKFLDFETLAMQGTRWTLNGTGSFATSAEVEVDPSNGDKTIVTGTVNLTGSVLKVLAAAGNYSASKQYIHHRQ